MSAIGRRATLESIAAFATAVGEFTTAKDAIAYWVTDVPGLSGPDAAPWLQPSASMPVDALSKEFRGWAKQQEFPPRMVDWDGDQVVRGYAEACRKLQLLRTGHSEAYEKVLAN